MRTIRVTKTVTRTEEVYIDLDTQFIHDVCEDLGEDVTEEDIVNSLECTGNMRCRDMIAESVVNVAEDYDDWTNTDAIYGCEDEPNYSFDVGEDY